MLQLGPKRRTNHVPIAPNRLLLSIAYTRYSYKFNKILDGIIRDIENGRDQTLLRGSQCQGKREVLLRYHAFTV